MTDWLGLGIIIAIVLGAIAALSFLGKPYEVTSEEFEKRAEEGMGLLGASVMGLQKLIEPQAEKAVEVMQDFRAGHYNGEQEAGDEPDDESANKGLNVSNVSKVEEHDA